MAENSIMGEIGEIIECFRVERSELKKELIAKEARHQKTVCAVSELPFVYIWQNPFKPILRRLLPRKLRKLKEEITNLQSRMEQCAQAEANLREKKYKSAILLLDEMINRLPATIPIISMGSSIDGTTQAQIRNQRFYYLLDLRQKLISLQEGKVETAIQ